jgi:NarL family two-component system response regulator LiaR
MVAVLERSHANNGALSRRSGRRAPAHAPSTLLTGSSRARRPPSRPRLTLALLDDDGAARAELRAALGRQRGLRVIAEAGRTVDLLSLVAETRPDVVAMDVLLRNEDGLDVIRRIRRDLPDVKVIVVTNQLEESLLLAAMRAGAHGYVDRMVGAGRVAAALRLVCAGERVLPDQRAVTSVVRELERLARADVLLRIGLSAEECELLALVAEGANNQTIADRLGCSLATVKRHLTIIYGKLQAQDRNAAIAEALRRGVL